jgi:FkbM family methyltransferase
MQAIDKLNFWLKCRQLVKSDKARSSYWPSHHRIFDVFRPDSPQTSTDAVLNFIGAKMAGSVLPEGQFYLSNNDIPQFGEEYFEWIDILTAASEARGKFVMLELGAGFGRWGAIGALAARRRGIEEIHLGLVEAEPQHAAWLHEHMANNAILPAEYQLYEVAVGGSRATAQFIVRMPGEQKGDTPRDWYGQTLASSASIPEIIDSAVSGEYFGRRLNILPSGWGSIDVEQVPLSEILSDYTLVDIVDMDVQGAEADVIEGSISELNRQVRRLHIGTHNADVEQRLRTTLVAAGWLCIRDWPCLSSQNTEFGDITFGDGVQSWANPRLIPLKFFGV